MSDKKVFKKTDKVVSREIENEVILLPLCKTSKDMNYIYTLNETAALVWDLIDGSRTFKDIKEKIMSEYEIEDAPLTKELNSLIEDLKSINAIK
ncbi:MAG: PqqD family protein [Candidatus Omnitrophota bacterium]